MTEQRFTVDARQAGQRLDKVVVTALPGLGRKGARRLFEEGRVRLNGKRPNKGDVAKQGDQVTIVLPDVAGPDAVAESDAPPVLRLQTPDLVVVANPTGQTPAPIRDAPTR